MKKASKRPLPTLVLTRTTALCWYSCLTDRFKGNGASMKKANHEDRRHTVEVNGEEVRNPVKRVVLIGLSGLGAAIATVLLIFPLLGVAVSFVFGIVMILLMALGFSLIALFFIAPVVMAAFAGAAIMKARGKRRR